MKLDPAIWLERAEMTILFRLSDAWEGGVPAEAVERHVRSTPTPFARSAPGGWPAYVWAAALDDTFTPRRRRRKGGA